MEKINWSVRKILALVFAIATPIVTIIMTGLFIDEGGYLIGIPMAIISYLLINGWTALWYALKRAFRILINHLVFPGFSLVGLLISIFWIMIGSMIGIIYFVFLPIVMFIMYHKEME